MEVIKEVEKIVEKKVEVPVEVIKEVEKIVTKEVPVEVIKEVMIPLGALSAAAKNVSKAGAKDGSLSVVGAGNRPYEYSIDGFKTAGQKSGTFNNLTAGAYTVSLRDLKDKSNLAKCQVEVLQPEVQEVEVEKIVEKKVEVIKEVEKIVTKEVPVEVIKEVEKIVTKEVPVEVIKEVEKIVTKEVPVEVIKEVEKIVTKEVPVEVIKEVEKIVTKEVPVEVIKEVEKIVEKKVEVPVEVIKEVVNEDEVKRWRKRYSELENQHNTVNKKITELDKSAVNFKSQIAKLNADLNKKPKEVEVIKEVEKIVTKKVEVPVEVIKEVEKIVTKEVEVIKEVPVKVEVEKIVTKEVVNNKELNKWKAKYKDLDTKRSSLAKENTRLEKELAKKPKEVEVIREIEVIKEVPIEIVKEVEVVKQIDFDSLKSMMMNMNTEVVSKQVVGETRTAKDAKVVERREVKPKSKKTTKKKVVAKAKATKAKAKPKVAPKAKVAKAKASATKAKKDDLKKIEGIGPKIEQLLNKDGIKTFKQLANAKVARLNKILDNAGPRYRMHNPGSWPKQSGLAAKGEWKKLDKLQDKLQGGR